MTNRYEEIKNRRPELEAAVNKQLISDQLLKDFDWLLMQIKAAGVNKPVENMFYLDQFYIAFGRFPSTYQLDELNYYIDKGMEEDMLSFAFRKAALANANFKYAIGILRSWEKAGIKTMRQAREEGKSYDERKLTDGKDIGQTKSAPGDESTRYYW